MEHIKKILVPIDFSPCSLKAIDYAIEIAKEKEAKVYLLKACPDVVYATDVAVSVNDMLYDKKAAEEQMDALEDKLEKKYGKVVEISGKVKEGEIETNIEKIVGVKDIDLLVMGTNGADNFVQKFFGSNTTFVIKHVNIPTLVVPFDAKPSKLENAVFAYDYKDVLTNNELNVMCDILHKFDTKLEVLKVVVDKKEISSDEAEAVNNMDDYLHQHDIDFKYGHIFSDDVVDGLNAYMKKQPTDLMVVMPQKHSFFDRLFNKSVTEELLLASSVPVLVLHEKFED